MGVAVFCLLGVSKSNPIISVTGPDKPMELGKEVQYYDWESEDARYLGGVKIISWNELNRAIENSSKPRHEFYMDWLDTQTLLRNNLFWFTRLGINKQWFPSYWELDFESGSARNLNFLRSYHLRKILTDSNLESTREDFFNRAVAFINSPEAENAWYTHKASLLHTYANWKDDEYLADDYRRIENATYKASMRSALDILIKNIDIADYEMKVMPVNDGWWMPVRVINNIIEFIDDTSPMRVQFACYRLGRPASRVVREYARRMKELI